MMEDQQKDDDYGNRNTQQPKQNSTAHDKPPVTFIYPTTLPVRPSSTAGNQLAACCLSDMERRLGGPAGGQCGQTLDKTCCSTKHDRDGSRGRGQILDEAFWHHERGSAKGGREGRQLRGGGAQRVENPRRQKLAH